MNREIKFRAWDKDNEIWQYGFLSDIARGLWKTIDWSKAFEFTGLKDKNGKEIYEGDILQAPKEYQYDARLQGRYATVFNKDDGRFEPEGWDNYGPNGEDNFSWESFEVIGNIYENPDLIK